MNRERLSQDNPTTYRIQVQGSLDQRWADYLGGMHISVNREIEPPVTTLSGQVLDQAALMGVLNGLYDLGFSLLYVECQPNETLLQS